MHHLRHTRPRRIRRTAVLGLVGVEMDSVSRKNNPIATVSENKSKTAKKGFHDKTSHQGDCGSGACELVWKPIPAQPERRKAK